MRLRVFPLAFCVAAALYAQMQMNVQQLADFIRSEIALRQHTDKQIAAAVRKIKLSEQLKDDTITDLEAQGAQPKTVEALRALKTESASLKPAAAGATYSPATAPDNTLTQGTPTATLSTKAPPAPPPDSVHQQQMLDAMRQYAMSYTSNLPNFFCVEVVRQGVDPHGGDRYQTIGHIFSKLSYNEGKEDYHVYSYNGKMVDTSMDKLHGGGAISSGEFGSLMEKIFDRASDAQFGWDHWALLRGRTMAVFNYAISSGHSAWSIAYSAGQGDEQVIYTAYRGLIYADPNTGEIDRIKFEAVDIPSSFPVRKATEVLDYDLAQISGQQYVVPLRGLLMMHTADQSSRNELEFRNYRKFGTESVITYDTTPLPESKTEEQPLNSAPPAAKQPAQTKPATTNSPWELPSAPPPPPQ